MEITSILFYIFSLAVIIASVAVISARNPVYSVLWLIFAFFNSAGLFVLLKAEMLAMLLVIVYVGAVAVLFLFVVMMLNIKTTAMKKGFQAYLPVGLILAGILFAEIGFLIISSKDDAKFNNETSLVEQVAEITDENKITNAEQIGAVLYTDNILVFQASGLILFVAMIGAIVLTLRDRKDVRKQDINKQNARTAKDAMELVKVKTGQGIS